MIISILRLILTAVIAFYVGKLVSKIKLPAILGWLVTGMILGPYALGVVDNNILNASWYNVIVDIFECGLGLLIGTELVWKRIKQSGKQIFVTTLTQSLGTFAFVTIVFAIAFYFTGYPLYLAVLFGGIALATAPAPALSIVNEFKTDGPVTKTLIPMAALDDMVAVVVFFTTTSIISTKISDESMPVYIVLFIVLLPVLIGLATGFIAGKLLKKENTKKNTLIILISTLLISALIGFVFNHIVLPSPVLNFMLIGMAFSAVFANMVSEERLEEIMSAFSPILGVAMIVVILNLGAPLDYKLILGAGLFTVIYIVARAIGKYGGAYFGASITKSPETVKKYLGLTLLPHSGVSLVFTGIATSILIGPDPESARVLQGTIAAAAVINEVLAVIIAKKAFQWAGECPKESGNISVGNAS